MGSVWRGKHVALCGVGSVWHGKHVAWEVCGVGSVWRGKHGMGIMAWEAGVA